MWVRLARRTLSATMRTRPSKLVVLSSVSERKRFLSHASAAFEISSRRKMSCDADARAEVVRAVGNAACALHAVATVVAEACGREETTWQQRRWRQ